MSKSTKLQQIKHDLEINKITRSEANALLVSLIENSEKDHYRVKCLEEFGEIIIRTEKNFQILENYLISDENPLIRSIVAKIILLKFPKLCTNPLKWVIKNDKSVFVIKNLINSLEQSNINYSKLLLKMVFDRLTEIYEVIPKEAQFIIDLEYELNPNFEMGFFRPVKKDKHIVALDFVGRKLMNLPFSIGALSFLKHLNLWDNYLTTLPRSVESLSNLQFLYLDWNKFKIIPDIQWDKFKLLEKLSLTNNPGIKKIPDSLLKLIKQNFVKKYRNEGVVTDEAPVLGLLEILTGMKLDKIQKKDKISKLYACGYRLNTEGSIIGIYLYGYYSFQINFIPLQICSLKYLKELILRDQNIRIIPDSIKKLNALKRLDLRRNSIKFIPECLIELKSLEFLDLGENKIKELPESIKLSNIELWL
ncbi:MAG: leucine-rich repeat domain-containing protein [Promethearchaeota archaeon]